MISKFIDNNKENILNTISDLIKIPSISDESMINTPTPFGLECDKALNYALKIAQEMGFRAKNIDGYCGYIEFGEGNELLGIIGHLDVVPAGDGWTKCAPFDPIIIDNKLYGRGAIDDKGPVISALYAMKYVMDTKKVNKRVRLILGLNEEKSWKCIEHYKEKEEAPTLGFSPDADFPCIYAEKGFLNAYISSLLPINSKIKLTSIECDNAINIVPKLANCSIELTDLNAKDLQAELNTIIEENNFHIDVQIVDESHIKLKSNGVAAHSAHPDLGINALSRLLIVLNTLCLNHGIEIPIFKFINDKIGTTLNGEKMNIECTDESGNLTINIANAKLIDNELTIGLNLRIPVTIYSSIIKQKINDAALEYNSLIVKFADEKNALFVPKTDPLVTTLCDIFNSVTNLNCKPITCSGATYARAFNNVVSFGANMPGKMDMCHQADEYIDLDDLFTSLEIYIRAIWTLT